MPSLSDRVQTFTDSVIRRMTRISDAYGAINLSQGFPDYDPPQELLDALAYVAHHGPHQYSITFGAQNFREALAEKVGRSFGRAIDPDREIVVTCGGTEAMMCAVMTVCNPGDKILVFSPFYENYGADTILSGADPIYVPLVPPDYGFDLSLIEEGFRQGAKAIIVCNPSNPCGKVFTREELSAIGALALYISQGSIGDFQPMNINFGIIRSLDYRVKGKRNKNAEISRRSLAILEERMKKEVFHIENTR